MHEVDWREGGKVGAEVKHWVEGLVTQKSRSQQLPTQEIHTEGGGSRAETDPNPVGLPFWFTAKGAWWIKTSIWKIERISTDKMKTKSFGFISSVATTRFISFKSYSCKESYLFVCHSIKVRTFFILKHGAFLPNCLTSSRTICFCVFFKLLLKLWKIILLFNFWLTEILNFSIKFKEMGQCIKTVYVFIHSRRDEKFSSFLWRYMCPLRNF